MIEFQINDEDMLYDDSVANLTCQVGHLLNGKAAMESDFQVYHKNEPAGTLKLQLEYVPYHNQ